MDALVVDASVFLSSFLDNEVRSLTSRLFFESLKKEGIKITLPILTLFEVLHNFYRVSGDMGKTEAVHDFFVKLSVANEIKILSLDASFLSHFFSFHKNFDLKTSDTIIVLTAHREKVPLISWDKKMLKQGAKSTTVYTPEEYLELLA